MISPFLLQEFLRLNYYFAHSATDAPKCAFLITLHFYLFRAASGGHLDVSELFSGIVCDFTSLVGRKRSGSLSRLLGHTPLWCSVGPFLVN